VPVRAFEGESVATALLADDRLTFRRTDRLAAPRSVFCAMGICYECLVTVDGISKVRGCMMAVREGMSVQTRQDS
jgi:sarcosine oxidase subunit alpha